MSSTLPEVRTRLYKIFDAIADRAENPYNDAPRAAEGARAAAAVAQAIVVLDERIEENGLGKGSMRLPAQAPGQG